MPEKKSDGRGWFFESMRHSLSAKGVKTGQKQQPKKRPLLIGRYADKWPEKKPKEAQPGAPGKKPLLQQVEQDPGKKWLWGVKLTPAQQKIAVREAARKPLFGKKPEEKPVEAEPVAVEEKPAAEQKVRIEVAAAKEEPKEQKASGFNPQALEAQAKMQAVEPPSKAVMQQRSKSRKAKFESVEAAWDAAQDELAQRYGDDGSSSSGVVKDEDEAEAKMSRNMGVH